MKLVISEYLRTLKERDELDRLLPDLLSEIGYSLIARPQTGPRQFGVDLAVRGFNCESNQEELILFVVKQGDIGRSEWDGSKQGVRASINEIFDGYLTSSVEPQDAGKPVRIVVTTNGDMKQTVLQTWAGFVDANQARAHFEFWGIDQLSALVEKHLFDEKIFNNEDRHDLRRALALAGNSDYDRRDLYRLFLRALDLKPDASLATNPKTGRSLIKALRIVNLSAHAFAAWAKPDGDMRQAINAMERALLWSWHRLQAAGEPNKEKVVADAFMSIWLGYFTTTRAYFEKLRQHYYVEDGLTGYYIDGCEFSLVAYEQIGLISITGLIEVFSNSNDANESEQHTENASVVAAALAALIANNNICNSPCLDRHSSEITLAMILLISTGHTLVAKSWLQNLVLSIDYAYKTKRYAPISSDSLDDLADEGGWHSGKTSDKLLDASWMLATLAGWCAILEMDEYYSIIRNESKASYPETCMQLWHPESGLYKLMYFKDACLENGVTEAPILLPETTAEWRKHMRLIVNSERGKVIKESPAEREGIPILDLIACRHYSSPVPPIYWYRIAAKLFPE